eukprot:TRINITY_DN19679_c0_g1_i1.p1 TRINITY_DN19679_c0_g1~~TRINITY_DN19679_c0_g1_i1.p1  ORF type:complete len:148 (-),score=23.46 TRINITY_DN19679_c0_g1_i1:62-505(-)
MNAQSPLVQAAKSAGGGLAAFTTYMATSSLGDHFTTPEIANCVGLAAGASLNFALQRRAFAANLAACRGGVRGTLLRYWIAEGIIVTSQQSLFVGGLSLLRGIEMTSEKKPKVEDSAVLGIRAASQTLVFGAVSFPLRRYWVFVRKS